jgi:UDP-glucose 4-epimerase
MDKVLVTGAGGFIGSHVVDALVESGKRVTALDRPRVPIHRRDLRMTAATIDDADGLARAFAGQDAVFHLAAVSDVNRAYADPVACVSTNVLGTANVLEAARRAGVGRVILASTVWVYNAAPDDAVEPLTEGTPLIVDRTRHVYTSSKVAGEMLLADWGQLFGLPYTVLRYGIPFGPRMRDELVIAKFIRRALAGEPLSVSHASRHFLYIGDLARAHVLALSDAAAGQTYNLEGPEVVTIREVAEAVRDLVGRDVVIEESPMRPGDYRDRVITSDKAKRDLGWEAEVPFVEGLRRTVDWFLDTIRRQRTSPSITSREMASPRADTVLALTPGGSPYRGPDTIRSRQDG